MAFHFSRAIGSSHGISFSCEFTSGLAAAGRSALYCDLTDSDLRSSIMWTALFGIFAIFTMSALADYNFKNCSLLEKSFIQGSVRHAQLLITFARVDGSSEFIETTDRSDSSQELIETHQRWHAGQQNNIIKVLAMTDSPLRHLQDHRNGAS